MKTLVSIVVLLICITSCNPKVFKAQWVEEEAPGVFEARFETTKGNFDIRSEREWSPEAVDRLYQLIDHGFYTDIAIFRVVPNFVTQFGISNDSIDNNAWQNYPIPDEPVIKTNEIGTISFARGGPKSRTTQIFINIKNNSPYLDELDYTGVKGFPVVAEVTSGMDVIKEFYNEYKNDPATKQDKIYAEGNSFLIEAYPKLDYITEAYILKSKKK